MDEIVFKSKRGAYLEELKLKLRHPAYRLVFVSLVLFFLYEVIFDETEYLPRGILLLVILIEMLYQLWEALRPQVPMICITNNQIRFRSYYYSDFKSIDIENGLKVEWPGFDNIGIRRKDGTVVSISLVPISESEWDDARTAVCSAVERAT